MKRFDYATALNGLGLNKNNKLNNINTGRIPNWVRGSDFIELFLPFLMIIGDSREQNKWIEKACEYYGIAFKWAKKGENSENLKEGDYTFKMVFGDTIIDYTGIVAYERKGAVSELYTNCTGYNKKAKTSDRQRITREFERFKEKDYKKVVLLLEFGDKLIDLIDIQFSFQGAGGVLETKSAGYTIYSALMSWKQPNNKGFEIIQSDNHLKLFWMFLQDCYYYFRNDIRKKIIKEKQNDKRD